MIEEDKIKRIAQYLAFAESLISNDHDFSFYYHQLSKIESIEQIESNSFLAKYRIPILWNLGFETLLEKENNSFVFNETALMLLPNYLFLDNELDNELSAYCAKHDLIFNKYQYKFTPELCSILYGGYPWFFDYYKLCEENKSLNKESYIYLIKGDGSKNCPNLIIDFKNLFRKKHSSVRIQKPLGNGYKVKINIIHSPLPIENENHLKAIKNYIILE